MLSSCCSTKAAFSLPVKSGLFCVAALMRKGSRPSFGGSIRSLFHTKTQQNPDSRNIQAVVKKHDETQTKHRTTLFEPGGKPTASFLWWVTWILCVLLMVDSKSGNYVYLRESFIVVWIGIFQLSTITMGYPESFRNRITVNVVSAFKEKPRTDNISRPTYNIATAHTLTRWLPIFRWCKLK